MYRSHVLVCGGTGCTSSGSQQIMETLKAEIEKNGLTEEVSVVQTGCHGLCALGPIMIIYPDATFYSMVKVEDIPEIVSEHLLKGRVVTRLLYNETVTPAGNVKALIDTDFYKKQHRIALRNCGIINPEVIEEYIGTGGYEALGKVLTEMTPDDVIQCLLDSGLRGRGGGGFPTGLKWKLAKQNDADQKYVCCNADEGDPGAFMDRSVLEGDPHAVLEAMAIAGYAIGASQGYIYVRAEYPIAVERLKIAINQAREMELLGSNIFGSDFSFDIDLRLGAGAFVCGEETALMTSIEGNRGEPRPRPPFPAQKGLFGKPTILNNVETYANIPQIILHGAEWFASMGTEKSKGTKVFALGGKIHNTGLVEIPMGTTLREVIEEIGGGIPGGKKFKAAQTGGPSGGCIPAEHFDIPIDYDNLISIGSMMGSGGLIVMDEDDCMVDIAKFFLEFTVEPSACWRSSPRSPRARPPWKTWINWKNCATTSKRTPCAALDRPRPTRYSPPCASSATSTRHTSRRRDVLPAYVRLFCPTALTPRSAVAVLCAPATVQTTPSPVPCASLTSLTRINVSSAAPVWRNVNSVQSTRSNGGESEWRISQLKLTA